MVNNFININKMKRYSHLKSLNIKMTLADKNIGCCLGQAQKYAEVTLANGIPLYNWLSNSNTDINKQ